MGEVSEAQIVAALMRAGFVVLQPRGDNQRYDLVIECDGKFSRIQVKTGRIKGSSIFFETSSSARGSRGRRSYHGEVELFGIFVPEINRCYLVPVSITGKFSCRLRLAPSKSKRNDFQWAAAFELLALPQVSK